MNAEVLAQDTTIAARDDYPLGATVFTTAERPRAAVLINSATAVPRKIYRGFAAYLAERGCATVTYDYRGIGGSRPPSLKGFDTRTRDWVALDVAAAIDHVHLVWPDLPLLLVGHSFGGQALGLVPNNALVARAARRRPGRLLAAVRLSGKVPRLWPGAFHRRARRANPRIYARTPRRRRGSAEGGIPGMDRLDDAAALFLRRPDARRA